MNDLWGIPLWAWVIIGGIVAIALVIISLAVFAPEILTL
jgi:hypothetical protein